MLVELVNLNNLLNATNSVSYKKPSPDASACKNKDFNRLSGKLAVIRTLHSSKDSLLSPFLSSALNCANKSPVSTFYYVC